MHILISLFWNYDERRLRAGWRLTLQNLAFFLMLVGGGILLVFFPNGIELLGESFAFSALLQALTLTVSIFLAAWLFDQRPLADLGFHLNRRWWQDWLFGAALGGLLMFLIFVTQSALGWVTITDTFYSALPGTPFFIAILLPLAIHLTVGFYEELWARGYLLRNLAEGLNFRLLGGPTGSILLATLLTSAFFGLLHAANPNATLTSTRNIMLAGLLLASGYVLTGELALPIGLHFTWNFFQGYVFGWPVSGIPLLGGTFLRVEQGGPAVWTGGEFGPEAGLLGILAMGLGTLLIVLYVWLTRGRLGLHTPLGFYADRRKRGKNLPA